ncbi:LIRP-like [Toxorhynchites rutilus septentrionalis]|uniref:LIRP-like n=1 Tax=Toxorhynchites rutilus septentrionalis TaxID=329112 RepID=UPI0024798E71|nr:LIRP-like [Toxorhynchites rutilus septentrionalis]
MNSSSQLNRGLSIMQLVLVLLMASSVAANQRFCGKQLVMILSMLCDEYPDLHNSSKKSMIDLGKMDYANDDWMNMIGQDQDVPAVGSDLILPAAHTEQQKIPLWVSMMYPQDYPFRAAAVGRNDLIPTRFRKNFRGIVDECCLRPCGYNQLIKYCKTVA